MSRHTRICDGCGDDYPYDMMFESLNDDYICAYCLGFDPMNNQPDNESMTTQEVYDLFWDNIGKTK